MKKNPSLKQNSSLDILPFKLPNTPPHEVRFEETRDIQEVRIFFKNKIPRGLTLYYLQKLWPKDRNELIPDDDAPLRIGVTIEDWFNVTWRPAAIEIKPINNKGVSVTFSPLTREFPEYKDYAVNFRRTLGIKIECENQELIKKIQIFTVSPKKNAALRVRLDAGKRTPGKTMNLSGYNALIQKTENESGVSIKNGTVHLKSGKNRSFRISVDHLLPPSRHAHDDGHLTFQMEKEMFTISLPSLFREGAIWYQELGIFITREQDPTTFSDYLRRHKQDKTILQKLKEMPEQNYYRAYHGQPRPQPVSYNMGCKFSRQRFWLEPNGDVTLLKRQFVRLNIPTRDLNRFKNTNAAKWMFGFQHWHISARYTDPPPILAYNIIAHNNNIWMEQKSFAVPLADPGFTHELRGDDTVVLLVRFVFRNLGEKSELAELPLQYCSDSEKSLNYYFSNSQWAKIRQDEHLIKIAPRDPLTLKENRIFSDFQGEPVLRGIVETNMPATKTENSLVFKQMLQPGQQSEIILKIPFIALDEDLEIKALSHLDFEGCYKPLARFWRKEGLTGAQLKTPIPQLNTLHQAHLCHIAISDFAMPDDPRLVNTSVGTSTYGNFSNESCMIIHDLDERGLHEEAERRLELWIKYQGTATQNGLFTDFDGMFYGAAGFEEGQSYNQHHGWVLWAFAEHYFLTGQIEWLNKFSDPLIKGCDWVFRQRKNTMKALPHSRGWENGLLPAGSLEDVTDFFYWLATNVLTWRGVDRLAAALEEIKHSDALRIREEASNFRKDLVRCIENMRSVCPLVRLGDGRWIPYYPSRLYNRGRDYGWIREVLEGSIYLILSGLYPAESKTADSILEDFQDNRYVKPPYGYHIPDKEINWYYRAGFSMQPFLLGGLIPHLQRDESEIYIWMFFNAWHACYREEINGLSEHPYPELGYSNPAQFKTSDEANATQWLRYLFIYSSANLIHFGRALPRDWLKSDEEIYAEGIATYFGKVGIRYQADKAGTKIVARVNLDLRKNPDKILVRFRHPEKKILLSYSVNGQTGNGLVSKNNDVEISASKEEIIVEALF